MTPPRPKDDDVIAIPPPLSPLRDWKWSNERPRSHSHPIRVVVCHEEVRTFPPSLPPLQRGGGRSSGHATPHPLPFHPPHFLLPSSTSPLILGTPLPALTPELLDIVSNAAVISFNQDALGMQAKKLLVGGNPTPRFVGLAPCDAAPGARGHNGVSAASLAWTARASTAAGAPAGALSLVNTETNRCLAMGPYNGVLTPLLFPCNAADAAQAWVLPTGASTLGALLWVPALANSTAAALAVGASTLFTSAHGPDLPLPDANYGLTNITLAPYAPEPPCKSRDCQGYAPEQSWYWSARTGKLYLGSFAANDYRCFGPNCYQLTSHLPTAHAFCLAHVLSYNGNLGTTPGHDAETTAVWGGALSGGDYVMVLVNTNSTSPQDIVAPFESLEAPGVGPSSTLCAKELFSGVTLGMTTGAAVVRVNATDAAIIRLSAAC